jgi:ribosomal protein S18 acetylase RimI-like enzyme
VSRYTIPLLASTLSDIAGYLNRAFTDYLIPFHFTPTRAATLLLQEGVDYTASRLLFDGNTFLGMGLIARRGYSCRMTALGVDPAARRQGVGQELVRSLLVDAKQRGEHTMWLEVISQNTAAVKLYQANGFTIQQELWGFTGNQPEQHTPAPIQLEPSHDTASPNTARHNTARHNTASPNTAQTPISLQAVDPFDVAKAITYYAPADLPWQLSGSSVMHTSPGHEAWRREGAAAIISDPSHDTIAIRGLYTEPHLQRQGQAKRLLTSLFHAFPGKTWQVPIVVPAGLAGLFQPLGMERETLQQFQMVKYLH